MKKLVLLMLLASSLSAHAGQGDKNFKADRKNHCDLEKSLPYRVTRSKSKLLNFFDIVLYHINQRKEKQALNVRDGIWVKSSTDFFVFNKEDGITDLTKLEDTKSFPQYFNVFKIKEDGTTDSHIANHPLPSIAEKKLCNIHSMSNGLVGFTFGTINEKEQQSNYPKDINIWRNRETRIFDIHKKEFVKFNDFDLDDKAYQKYVSFCKDLDIDPLSENVFIFSSSHELCDTEGAFPINSEKALIKSCNGYKYYNFKTGELGAKVFDALFEGTLVYNHKEDGTYDFLYAYTTNHGTEENPTIQTVFKKISQQDDGSFTASDLLATIEGNDFVMAGIDKTKIIAFKKNDKGFRVPHLLDLNSENPTLKNILTDEEERNLKTDVCDVLIKEDKIVWCTNFEKVEEHESRLTLAPSIKNPFVILKSLIEKQKTLLESFSNDSTLLEKNFDEISALINNQNDPALKTSLMRYNTEHFREFLKTNIIGKNVLDLVNAAKKWMGQIKSDVIDIPHTSFKMPVYTVMANPSSPHYVLNYHGGPSARNNNTIREEQLIFTYLGYNVVEHNFRGSSGFGTEYQNTLNGNWFNHTREDTDLVIKHLREKEGLPQNALPTAFGISFGGYAAVNAFVNKQCTRAIVINGTYDLNFDLQDQKLKIIEENRESNLFDQRSLEEYAQAIENVRPQDLTLDHQKLKEYTKAIERNRIQNIGLHIEKIGEYLQAIGEYQRAAGEGLNDRQELDAHTQTIKDNQLQHAKLHLEKVLKFLSAAESDFDRVQKRTPGYDNLEFYVQAFENARSHDLNVDHQKLNEYTQAIDKNRSQYIDLHMKKIEEYERAIGGDRLQETDLKIKEYKQAVNLYIEKFKEDAQASESNQLQDLNAAKHQNFNDPFYKFWTKKFGATEEIREKNSLLEKIEKREDAAMLIIAGSEDENCNPEGSDRLFEKMKQVGNKVDYFKIMGMGHGPKTESGLCLLECIVATWLAKVDDQKPLKYVFDLFKDVDEVLYQEEALRVKSLPYIQEEL